MKENLAVKLVSSMVEHVPIYFDSDRLLDLLISTELNYVHSPLNARFRYEKITEDKYGCFYPTMLLRNDIIVYEPKKLRLFHKFSKVLEPFDYIAELLAKKEIVNIFREASSPTKSNLYSILGMVEMVSFIYDDSTQSEKVVLKPQLIIPGFELNNIVFEWENSQIRSYSNKDKAMEI